MRATADTDEVRTKPGRVQVRSWHGVVQVRAGWRGLPADADCEDNCDDVGVDDSLSLYRSSSFRRAIERGGGGGASPPTPTADQDAAAATLRPGYLPASRFTPSLAPVARLSAAAASHQQTSDPSSSYRFSGSGQVADGSTRRMNGTDFSH